MLHPGVSPVRSAQITATSGRLYPSSRRAGVPPAARHNQGGTTRPHKGCAPTVNPTIRRQSTTATPASLKQRIGRATAIGAGLASSATAVTLPTAIHALGHKSMALALTVGLAPAVPLLLVVVAVVTMYVIASMVAVFVALGRVIHGRAGAADAVDDLFGSIINAPIALLTLTPLKPRARSSGRNASNMPVLPAAPAAARKLGTPVYWETLQEMVGRPGGAADIVPREDDDTQPIRGRHERPEADAHPKSGSRSAAARS